MAGPLLKVASLVKRYHAPGWPGARRSASRPISRSMCRALLVCSVQTVPARQRCSSSSPGATDRARGECSSKAATSIAIRYRERDRLAIHYHQSYQVRRFRKTVPSFLLERANRDRPRVHLFDEPQFAIQDGYIGFMLAFFARLREEGNVVFLCVHPNEPFHLEILREACDSFVFVQHGRLKEFDDFRSLVADPGVRAYLGGLAPELRTAP